MALFFLKYRPSVGVTVCVLGSGGLGGSFHLVIFDTAHILPNRYISVIINQFSFPILLKNFKGVISVVIGVLLIL
jgi:hypothetical protein